MKAVTIRIRPKKALVDIDRKIADVPAVILTVQQNLSDQLLRQHQQYIARLAALAGTQDMLLREIQALREGAPTEAGWRRRATRGLNAMRKNGLVTAEDMARGLTTAEDLARGKRRTRKKVPAKAITRKAKQKGSK